MSILVAVRGVLQGDETLRQILGGATVLMYHKWAPPGTQFPYLTASLEEIPDVEAYGLSSGQMLLDVWDSGPNERRVRDAGARIEWLLDALDLPGCDVAARAVRMKLMHRAFLDTDSESVHRLTMRWSLRYVRQSILLGR